MNHHIEKRKESILKEATLFFAQNGYRNTDVQTIADHLEIGKGTVYRYFPTKEALFLACCDRAMDMLEDYIHTITRDQQDPMQRLLLGMQSYIIFLKNHPELVEIFVQERCECKTRNFPTYFVHRARRNTRWRETLTALQNQGRIRPLDLERIMDTLSNFLYGSMFTKIFQEEDEHFEEQAKASLEMILYGICISDYASKREDV